VIRPTALAAALAAAALANGCGQKVEVPGRQPMLRQGATLFHDHCSGCHSLAVADARGSKPTRLLQHGERTNGPNFNIRHVNKQDALFAIRNGGFSGAIMPANVVVGRDADLVASFLASCTGRKPAAVCK
jgi:mono/diheme cytochrome c family protein